MGKAQSKRSVDITTENKEGVAVAEGEAGKVGKIEEIDQKPQLNGEANKDADSGVSDFLLITISHAIPFFCCCCCMKHKMFSHLKNTVTEIFMIEWSIN